MLTYYSDDHHLHHGNCELMPCFEKPQRADHILARVKERQLGEVRAPKDFGRAPIERIHSAACLDFFEEAQLYGKNDDYYGMDLEQDPLYRLQAFASYDFTPATYGALRLIHADGGELRLGGERLDGTHQGYTQIGFELGHWLDQKNQLLFSLSRNVDTDNCYHGEQALLRLAHVF